MAVQTACINLGGNVSEQACAIKMGRPLYLLPTQGKIFSANDIASSAAFKAALRTAMLLATGNSNKVYSFPIIREVEDTTEDVERGTLADGYSEVLSEKVPNYTIRTTGSTCQAQAMARFNGWQDKVFVVDHNKRLWYVKTDTGGAQGFSVGSLYTNAPRFAAGGAVITTSTSLSFGSVDEFKDNVGALQIDFDPTKLVNTSDVVLKEVDAASGYVFTIGGQLKCVETDIYDAYSSLLAVAGAWKAKRLDTGAAVTVSNAAADAAHKGWDITLASSPTIAQDTKIEISLQDPTTLAGLTSAVLGIESVLPVVVTKPA